MLPVLLLIAGAAVVTTIVGCSSDGDGNKPHGTDDGGPDTDTIDTDTGTEDVDAGPDADVDAGPDPWERDGFNGIFSDPKVSGNSCPLIDLDIDANRMRMMCSYPINRMGAIDLDSADPMNLDPLESAEANFGAGSQNFIGMTLSGYGEVIPFQVQPLSNGYQMVPFFSSKDVADGGTYEISGLAFINSSGTVNTSLVDLISFPGDPSTDIHPVSIASGVVSQGRLFLPSTESISGQGLVLSYGINSGDGTIDHNDVRLPVMTSGDEPSAIAEASSTSVAVLNTSGAGGATIDIITTSEGDPASAIIHSIPLGVDQAVPLPELPMTSDNHYAVVAGGTGSAMSNILVVDLVAHSVASVNLGAIGAVRGIAVRGNRAYVSLDDGTASASSGKVAIVNFSTPAAPVQEGSSVSVGYDLGAIVVHSASCATFVVVTDPWWMEPGTSTTKWSHIVAFDPEIAAGVACGGI